MILHATIFHLRFRFEQKIEAKSFFVYFMHVIISRQFKMNQNSGMLEKFSKLNFLEHDVSSEKMLLFVPQLFLHVKLLSYMIRIYMSIFYFMFLFNN